MRNIPPTNTTYTQSSHHCGTQHTYGYQTQQHQFPSYPTYSNDRCYRPSIELIPLPTRPNFKNMGNMLFESGSSRYANLTYFMDADRIDFIGPSTQLYKEIHRGRVTRRGRGMEIRSCCNLHVYNVIGFLN